MKQKILIAMKDPDRWVIRFRYCNSGGEITTRVVSPIRFLGSDRFLGLCLSREAPRQFHIGRCRLLELCPAHEFVMPVPLAG